jgi:hypothetical protein
MQQTFNRIIIHDNFEVVEPVRRQRGRPRKIRPLNIQPKRPVGRPRKPREVRQPKPRGRPRKQRPIEEQKEPEQKEPDDFIIPVGERLIEFNENKALQEQANEIRKEKLWAYYDMRENQPSLSEAQEIYYNESKKHLAENGFSLIDQENKEKQYENFIDDVYQDYIIADEDITEKDAEKIVIRRLKNGESVDKALRELNNTDPFDLMYKRLPIFINRITPNLNKFLNDTGSHKILKKFYNQYNPFNNIKYLKLTIYGRLTESRESEPLDYTPDWSFNIELGTSIIDMSKGLTKKSIHDQLERVRGILRAKISEIIQNSFIDLVSGKLEPTEEVEAENPDQFLEYSNTSSNCFFNTIRKRLETSKNEKVKTPTFIQKLDNLEKQYIETGVPFKDGANNEEIKNIVKSLVFVDIVIYSKLGSQRFSSVDKKNTKVIVNMVLERINHVEPYQEISKDMNNKQIIYSANIEEDFKKSKGITMYKTDDLKKIKYFWNDTNIYKPLPTEEFDNKKYYIHNLCDVANERFIEINNLTFNTLYKNNDPELFNFINSSCHQSDEVIFGSYSNTSDLDFGVDTGDKEYSINLNDNICYDMNKCYASYKNNNYYNKHLFPSSSKFNFYKVETQLNDNDLKILFTKCGFIQIKNIIIKNKTIEKIKYFNDDYIYPIPVVEWLYNNGGRFDIVNVAFNIWKQEINMDEDIIKNKYYNKIIGCLAISDDKIRYNIKCDSYADAQYLKYTSNETVQFYENNNDIIGCSIVEQKHNMNNRAHIASYFYGYSIINILEHLKYIKFDDLRGIRVDCIILKNKYEHFKINRDIGGWKIEQKTGIKKSSSRKLIPSPSYFDFVVDNKLTNYKLNLNYINFVMGQAGTGKTTLFLNSRFGERLYNVLCTFPNNELCQKFKNENKEHMQNIDTSTYHKAFNIGCFEKNKKDNEDELEVEDEQYKKSYRSYNYKIIDESSMIGLKDFYKIIKTAKEEKTILLLAGDYDIAQKKLYQMKPIQDESFVNYPFIWKDTYSIKLTINYRQLNDINFTKFLQQSRGQSNQTILERINNSNIFVRKNYEYMINNYTYNDIILSPYKEGGKVEKARTDYINNILFNKLSSVNAKYANTSNGHVKNENIFLNKNDYDDKKYNLAYALTSHLIQGCEYNEDKKIYIINSRYFTDNQLYVLISRAKVASQIIFIDL